MLTVLLGKAELVGFFLACCTGWYKLGFNTSSPTALLVMVSSFVSSMTGSSQYSPVQRSVLHTHLHVSNE